jgi:hypothetical protein
MSWGCGGWPVRHAPDHIHLVATLARQHRIRPKVWNDYYQVRGACRDAEQWYGLRVTAPADRTAARRATRAETEQAARRGWQEPPRAMLRREVCTAAAGARTEAEFFARLAKAGVLVRRRYSSVNPGEVTGYAVGLAEYASKTGQTIWYGGGKLAADLTLPKLRARWVTWRGVTRSLGRACLSRRYVRCCGPRSRRRRRRPRVRRSSSSGCAPRVCWCGSGSARSTPVK